MKLFAPELAPELAPKLESGIDTSECDGVALATRFPEHHLRMA